MTTPNSKLNDLLWYAMPNLVCLAHSISNEELACNEARAEGVNLLFLRRQHRVGGDDGRADPDDRARHAPGGGAGEG